MTDAAELDRQDLADGVDQQVVAAVVDVCGRVLLLRRPPDDARGGEWEFPGGKVDPGEDLMTALRREVLEETGQTISAVGGYLGSFDYMTAAGRHNRQHTWSVTVVADAPVVLTEHDAHSWVADSTARPLGPELQVQLEQHYKQR
ncbi:NUDIX domain-containing protein [Saccharopolyspora sp. HNM0983]|uniref:8-oxo-dGTP diphosphatase n=1 Tax=Saccharopolyspora montiporae TaxID=2781240 RepID=A0A929FXD0_9PSEU|nr:NUDIX domain-containing protein [Saccharopolyspora sp. HNM0983]MBE9374541.1 NUDIX domain-containing protein [Saccharopolyspora sp. HNM0983]